MTISRSLGICAVLLALAMFPLCSRGQETGMTLTLDSPAFDHNGAIPALHTCQGRDTSPELRWSGVPSQARSLVLVVDDPDAPDPAAPQRVWVHWLLYNLPHDSTGLPAAVASAQLPAGTREGRNDWGRGGYGGPCPPIGRHRYFHKLYALDVVLPDLHQPDKAGLMKAMEGHVIAQAELVGTYQKSG